MFGTKFIKPTDIRELVDDLDVFRHYCQDPTLEPETLVSSPLHRDKNPSFCLFVTEEGNLLFHDFSKGETGDYVKLVGLLNNCSYSESLNIIKRDMKTGHISSKQQFTNKRYKQNISITISSTAFKLEDFKYWLSYGIHVKHLRLYNVRKVNSYWISKGGVPIKVTPEDLTYAYCFSDGAIKIYRPHNTDFKFSSDIKPTTPPEGHAQLDYKFNSENNDLLIITKSMKDVMVYRALGYYAVSGHSETNYVSPGYVIEYLKKYKNVIVNTDYDPAGIKAANHYKENYGINGFFLDDNEAFKNKDISDLVNNKKLDYARTYVKNKLQKKL